MLVLLLTSVFPVVYISLAVEGGSSISTDLFCDTDFIDWGKIGLGETIKKQIVIVNIYEEANYLVFEAQDYTPKQAEQYLVLSSDYDGIVLQPNEKRIVTLSLYCDPQIKDVSTFTFNIMVYVNQPEKTEFSDFDSFLRLDNGDLTLYAFDKECYFSVKPQTNLLFSDKTVNKDSVSFDTALFSLNIYKIFEGLEYEIILKSKPTTNVLSFPLVTKDLVFYYQPSLMEELNSKDYDLLNDTHAIKDGNIINYRPLNVVGSYAVYHTSKSGNEYGTGKAFHLYRVKLIDALGKEVYAEYNRDVQESGQLQIILPTEFLNSALYPVVIDPAFGYMTVGASNYNSFEQGDTRACVFTTSEAGEAYSVTARIQLITANRGMVGGLYGDTAGSPNALLDVSTERHDIGTTAGWYTFSFVNYSLVSSTAYWITVRNSRNGDGSDGTNYAVWYDAGSAGQTKTRDYPSDFLMTDPFGTVEDSLAYKLSIFCNYTVEAGLNLIFSLTETLSFPDILVSGRALKFNPFVTVSFLSSVSQGKETRLSLVEIVELIPITASLYPSFELAAIVRDYLIYVALALATLAFFMAVMKRR